MKVFMWIGLILILKYTFANELNRNGIWVKWSADKDGVPENAVNSGSYYVIRVLNDDESDIVGKYRPSDGFASYPYNNKEYKANDFEILTHTNWFWQNKVGQPNYLIPGGYDSNRTTIWICQASTDYGKLPGMLYNGKCNIGHNKVDPQNTDWATLKRRDNNL